MPPSPNGTPWVVEIEDPASIHLELLHIPPPSTVPTTPAGGRRRCSAGLRSWVVGSREPRHRSDSPAVSPSAFRLSRPSPRAVDRAVAAVALACTVIGVWLGSLAPATSPVSAPRAAGVQHRVS
jgi:hypothetical protein